MSDNVNHPPHYTASESGVECIDIVEHMSFNLGNAVKYLWRRDLKGRTMEDVQKAAWYLAREQRRLRSTESWQERKTRLERFLSIEPHGILREAVARLAHPSSSTHDMNMIHGAHVSVLAEIAKLEGIGR